MERRLSAIFTADVVGFSRLMGSNEVGTLTALKAHRREVIDIAIAKHTGRIVKLTGDGLIAEFPSVVNAMQCAAEIQVQMRARNVDVPEDRRMLFRIGINVGDVIFEENDVFGDGVNVAARIEALARPGGIAVSGAARDHIGNKLDFDFEDAGEQILKNIEQPVRIFHISLESDGTQQRESNESTSKRPSIAVLPFLNMSDDLEQEYFADGITEDVITDLSKLSGLFVVGRNSTFVYKGKHINLQRAAQELGVRYILEGSVRKAGQRVRIAAQLIDGTTGGHVWADRYDRDLMDIFAVQDDIAKMIIRQLQIRLLDSESRAVVTPDTNNVDAYTYYLRGRQYYHMRTKQFVEIGRRMFLQAVQLDPRYARGYAGIADCDSFLTSWVGSRISVDDILRMANKALEIDPNLAEAHAARGLAFTVAERSREAASSFQMALSIDPFCYEAHYHFARSYVVQEDFHQAANHFIRALEIRPDDYRSPLLLGPIFKALGREDDRRRYIQLGLKRADEALARHPENADPLELGAAVLAASGEHDRARDWLDRAMVIDPDLSKPRYNIACAYSQLGEVDRALDIMERILKIAGPEAKDWIRSDSDMDPIRDHPRFQALLGPMADVRD